MKATLSAILGRVLSPVVRFHRDQRGDALEYLLILAAFVLPMLAVFAVLKNILSDYYSMIAFFVGWPFL